MDPIALIAVAAGIVGIAAGLVQVVDYVQKRRKARIGGKETIAESQQVASVEPQPPLGRVGIPHNLPSRGEFIGREREKAQVHEALSSRSFLISIDGIGGIGKTSLALEVLHECLRASEASTGNHIPTFEAIIWTTAKGRDLTLNDILDAVAHTLELRSVLQLELEDKRRAIVKRLQDKKYLLVVDNFETIKDAAIRDFLLNLPELSKALITSRQQNLRQVRAISLKGLEQDEALELIRSEGRRLGLPSVREASDQILLRLYEATGGAPLALKWAIGQVKQRGRALDTVLDHLYHARGDIFEAIFAQSWQLLSESSRQVLISMPAFAASASRSAIEAASDVHTWDLDEAIGQLVEMWLMEPSPELDEASRRYSIHPLTRAFAEQRGKENESEYYAIQKRASEYFLRLLREQGDLQEEENREKLDEERQNIYTRIEWAYRAEEWRLLIDFTRSIGPYLWVSGHWSDRIKYCKFSVEACREIGDERNLAWLLVYDLGWTVGRQGNLKVAKRYLEEGKSLFEKVDDKRGLALARRHVGNIAAQEGDFKTAQALVDSAQQISQEIGDTIGMAYGKVVLANLARLQRDIDGTEKHIEDALKYFENEDDRRGVARGLFWMGLIASDRGQWPLAKGLFLKSIREAEKAERLDLIADCNYCLAVIIHHADRNPEDALNYVKEALRIYELLGMEMPRARELADQIIGVMAEPTSYHLTEQQNEIISHLLWGSVST
jgi:tetratricopeptide (TPR) repeat protein